MTKNGSIKVIALCVFLLAGNAFAAGKPRLVLQVTVDQLRGDIPFRYEKRFGPGGFRYLMENGVWYSNAHHPHANTETIVGHVTLATGTTPSRHGMVGNVLRDRKNDRVVYNIEDAEFPLVGKSEGRNKDVELDASSKFARSEGRSPVRIIGSTFADELIIGTARKGKAFSVSGKDRAAVALAGHAGKAFWYSTATGQFVSSTYYYDDYPVWVKAWNAKKYADRYRGKKWELSRKPGDYLFFNQDDRPYEIDLGGFGKTFPHPFGGKDNKFYYPLLLRSPIADELTADFARQLMENERLGEDAITDFLHVSFSSTDYIGHFFGPSSLESEENQLRLDRTLADLFAFVDKKVGLENTLIVLTSDHGIAEIPEYSVEAAGLSAGRVEKNDFGKWVKEILEANYKNGGELMRNFYPPYVFLDEKAIAKRGLNLAQVEKVVADGLRIKKGIGVAVSASALMNGKLPDTPLNRLIVNNHHPERSGNVYVMWEQHWTIDDGVSAVKHGSPWSYDTHVPIVFAGLGYKGKRIPRKVSTADVTPTLCAILNLRLPSAATGEPLTEALE